MCIVSVCFFSLFSLCQDPKILGGCSILVLCACIDYVSVGVVWYIVVVCVGTILKYVSSCGHSQNNSLSSHNNFI